MKMSIENHSLVFIHQESRSTGRITACKIVLFRGRILSFQRIAAKMFVFMFHINGFCLQAGAFLAAKLGIVENDRIIFLKAIVTFR